MSSTNKKSPVKKIAFVHPDLGIGGAERLVVDAAVGLQNIEGNEVIIYTSHCDKTHCFEEVSSGVLNVKVYGDFLPTHVLKKFHILFAILRQLYLTLKLITTGEILEYDFFIVDQLSFCIPLLSLFSREDCRILFYCHFPDQLLAKRGGLLKKLYRLPFDAIEEWTTGYSDRIVVNSNFTKGIFHETFKHLNTVDPGVIYPCVDTAVSEDDATDEEVVKFFKGNRYFLSINRFERKKDIELAITAFSRSRKLIHGSKPRLVIAGGYDIRVLENVEYLNDLSQLCDTLKLTSFTIRGKLILMPPATDVLFLPSIRSSLKSSLIKHAELLLYTPSLEHFGIVPVESMLLRTPVLAINNGGPVESVVNYDFSNIEVATGFTADADYQEWAKIMIKYFNEVSPDVKTKLGENGYKRVLDKFSRAKTSDAFMDNLKAAQGSQRGGLLFTLVKFWKLGFLVLLAAIVAYRFK
ncbi:mannosyltransferase [Scheffersomyces xylosifermentans]|uniref:mannosyltransferase n=1 Tax=Scheffersomyces xylosifermentans TaxID=1304137 RepID=UPI00315DAD50